MENWELLISVISGFVVAFFAEPIKISIIERRKTRKLRYSIYKEMGALYKSLKLLMNSANKGGAEIRRNIHNFVKADCYLYAKSIPIQFYSLKDAVDIDIVYNNFLLLISGELKNDELGAYLQSSLSNFEKIVKNNRISKKLLIKKADGETQKLLNDFVT